MTLEFFLTYAFTTILGLTVGSFLNVVAYRIVKNESIIFPSSHCPICDHPLKIKDLIPLLSFFMLKGSCRYCKTAISWRYPLVEIITALLFIANFYFFPFSLYFFKFIVILSLLLIISLIDLQTHIIPNLMVILIFIWSIAWQLFYPSITTFSAVLGFLCGGGIFFAVALISKGGMGGGDVKLMAVLGFIIGWPAVLMAFLLSFILGALTGILLIIFGKKTRKDPLPFGPFLAVAFFMVVFWGKDLWTWYGSFL